MRTPFETKMRPVQREAATAAPGPPLSSVVSSRSSPFLLPEGTSRSTTLILHSEQYSKYVIVLRGLLLASSAPQVLAQRHASHPINVLSRSPQCTTSTPRIPLPSKSCFSLCVIPYALHDVKRAHGLHTVWWINRKFRERFIGTALTNIFQRVQVEDLLFRPAEAMRMS